MSTRRYSIASPSDDVPERARRALASVIDPELGIDVVMLGLIYDIRHDANRIEIDMTLTTPGCPVSEQLPQEARHAVALAFPEHQVDLHVVWDPPWSPELLSPDAMEILGFTSR